MQIVDAWLRDLPQQFQGKERIEILISAFAKQLQEVEQVFADLNDLTDVDTATGKNLDYVGTIIPLSRKEAGILAGEINPDVIITDERYRRFLKYQRLINTNECTYSDIMDGLDLLWGVSPVYYMEDPQRPATIILSINAVSDEESAEDCMITPVLRSAGVGLVIAMRSTSEYPLYVGFMVKKGRASVIGCDSTDLRNVVFLADEYGDVLHDELGEALID